MSLLKRSQLQIHIHITRWWQAIIGYVWCWFCKTHYSLIKCTLPSNIRVNNLDLLFHNTLSLKQFGKHFPHLFTIFHSTLQSCHNKLCLNLSFCELKTMRHIPRNDYRRQQNIKRMQLNDSFNIWSDKTF